MESDLSKKTTAYLTHELRAPLTAIHCALELIEESGACSRREDGQTLAIALRNTERLKRLIDDILDLSQVQSGRMTLSTQACEPAALVREAVESLEPWARKNGIKLSAACAQSCAKVSADPRRTVQVLVNLISNAIKFTPAGGSIRVSAEPGHREHAGTVGFSVRDTGRGISQEDQRKLFRFFSKVGSEEGRPEGSGLGLALSRSLVELQGGAIEVESKPSRGSTFRFTLPGQLPAAAAKGPRSSQRGRSPLAEGAAAGSVDDAARAEVAPAVVVAEEALHHDAHLRLGLVDEDPVSHEDPHVADLSADLLAGE